MPYISGCDRVVEGGSLFRHKRNEGRHLHAALSPYGGIIARLGAKGGWCAGRVWMREQIARGGLVGMLGARRTYRVQLGWDWVDRAEAGCTSGRSERIEARPITDTCS